MMNVSVVDSYLLNRKLFIIKLFEMAKGAYELGSTKEKLVHKVIDAYFERFIISDDVIDNIRAEIEDFINSNNIKDLLQKKIIVLLFEIDSSGYRDDYVIIADMLSIAFNIDASASNRVKVKFTDAMDKVDKIKISNKFVIDNFMEKRKEVLKLYYKGLKMNDAINKFDIKQFKISYYPVKAETKIAGIITYPVYNQMGKANRFKIDEQLVQTDFLDREAMLSIEMASLKVLKDLLEKEDLIYLIKLTDSFFELKRAYTQIKGITDSNFIKNKICLEFSRDHFTRNMNKIVSLKKLGYLVAIDEYQIIEEEIDAASLFDYVILDKKPRGIKLETKIAIRDSDEVELLVMS